MAQVRREGPELAAIRLVRLARCAALSRGVERLGAPASVVPAQVDVRLDAGAVGLLLARATAPAQNACEGERPQRALHVRWAS